MSDSLPAPSSLTDCENRDGSALDSRAGCRSDGHLLAAALTYAHDGLAVLPLEGKRPVGALVRNGARSATVDFDTIEEWWSGGDYNVGAAIPEGYIVLDVDPRNGGDESLRDLVRAFGVLPETRTCATGGGGLHLWFRHQGPGPRLRRPGIDIKGPGGYMVMPPSVHADTEAAYEWANEAPVAPLPAWLLSVRDTAPRPTVRTPARTARDRSTLPPAAWDMLRSGDKSYGDTTRSGVFWSCLWYLVNAGWTAEQVMGLAQDPSYPGVHAYFRDRGPQHAVSQYERAIELSNQRNTARILKKLRTVELAAELATERGYWSGKGGSNELVVLEMYLALAQKVTKTSVRYTIGMLMKDGGFHRKQTVMAAVGRSEDVGWLEEKARPTGRKGVLYAIGVPQALREEVGHLLAEGVSLRGEMRNRLPVGHDAFATGDGTPGKTGFVILRCFPWPPSPSSLDGSGTAEELEKKGTLSKQGIEHLTGLSSPTVHRHLTDFTERGIVEKVGRGEWRRRPGIGPDEMANVFGTVGTGKEIARIVATLQSDQKEWRQNASGRKRGSV